MFNLNTEKIKIEGQALTESIICTDFKKPYWLYGKTILKIEKMQKKLAQDWHYIRDLPEKTHYQQALFRRTTPL